LPAVAPGLLKLIEEAFVQQKNWVFMFGGRFVKEEERRGDNSKTMHIWT
jgi:hypothetical protein